jgi:hypothetical protein
MKTVLKLTALAALTLAFSTSIFAQEQTATPQQPAATEAANTSEAKPAEAAPATDAKPASEEQNGVLYFYRIKQYAGSALEPSVYCDEKELARMDNGRYFGVSLAPGKHTCRMGDKQTGFELDVKAGQSYYAKVSIEVGFWKGHGRLTLLQPEQGAFELKKVKLIGVDKIKDKTLVTFYEGSEKAVQTAQ